MYKFTLHFLLAACPPDFAKTVRAMDALPNFSHTFEDDPAPDPIKLASADVIVAGPGLGAVELGRMAAQISVDADLLLLREKTGGLPGALLERATDIWRWPLEKEEIRFHFSRWQRNFRQAKDLAETRQFLECVLDTTPNLVWFKRSDGIHELVNRAFCEVVNKTRADVQGRGHAYIWNVDSDDPACIESERIVMESGKTHVSEEAIETGGGRLLLKTYKSPLRAEDGSMMGTVGVAIDVTRERQYEESLLRNNSVLETLFAGMDCGVVSHSPDGAEVYGANGAALAMLGQSLEELKTGFAMVSSTVVDEDRDKLRGMLARLKKAGDSTSYEYRVKHRDGSIVHIMGTARLMEQDGKLVCRRLLLDGTALRQARDKEEQERKRRLRELVRALAVDFQLVGVIDTRADSGEIIQLQQEPDKRLWEIFSGPECLAEKIRIYTQNWVCAQDRKEFASISNIDAMRAKLAKENIFYFNYRVGTAPDLHYFQLKAARGADADGAACIVIGLQSINARVRQEMERKNRLGEALARARKASEAKSVFLSNMSHDIRTPMNAIAGYTALARKSLDNPEIVDDYLLKIGSSCEHLISLINDILDMSHIESGRLRLDEKACDLKQILRELWNIALPTSRAKNQTLELDINIANAGIYCDRLRLNQIVLNLLSNAVKYTPAGGSISLGVSQEPVNAAGEAVYRFCVKDNGIGMSDEFMQRIFEPFERAQSSTIAGIQGTGLGMAITKNFVELMRGTITVSSQLGVGSEFVLEVPFRIDPDYAGQTDSPSSDAAQSAGLPAGLNFCRVLLVEDNAMNQEIACEFLQSAGYTVEVAGNGRDAVDMIKNNPAGYYNVVLMDVQMPVLDGYGATRLIRALPDKALASVPILAMTANSFEEDRQEAFARGMNGHIAKPIDFNLLFAALNELLGARS